MLGSGILFFEGLGTISVKAKLETRFKLALD